MRYVSTRGQSAPIGFLDAVLAGLVSHLPYGLGVGAVLALGAGL